MRQTDVGEEQRCCSLAEERQKKTKKETHREVKSSFPMLYLYFKGLVGSWGISQHALGTRQGKIFGSDPPDLVDLVITTEMQPP